MALRVTLPGRNFDHESSEVMKLGLGLTTTMNALILGLLISTAKNSYDLRRAQVTQIAGDAILIDRTLRLYGPESSTARLALRDLLSGMVNQIESVSAESTVAKSAVEAEDFYYLVRRLKPQGEEQRSLKAEVLQASFQVGRIRAVAFAQESSSIPLPFLIVLVFWLAMLFVGYGLFTPVNLTVVCALIICALMVSTALLMILAMDEPLKGIMHISPEPLTNAISIIGR